MDYQRILLLAGLLITSYMLVLAWNQDYGQGSKRQTSDATIGEERQSGREIATDELPAEGVPSFNANAGQASDIPATTSTFSEEIPKEESTIAVPTDSADRKLIRVETDVLLLQIDPLGGDIVKASLKAFPISLEEQDVPYVLMDPVNRYTAQTGIIGPDGTDGSEGRPIFRSALNEYQLDESRDELTVDLLLEQATGTNITKRFVFNRSDYLIKIEYHIDNNQANPWRGKLFSQIKRNGKEPAIRDESGMGMQPYVGGATYIEDEPYHKLEFDDLEDESYRQEVNGGYMAMVQKYFVTAFVPENKTDINVYQARKLSGRDVYLFGLLTPDWTIAPHTTATRSVNFYVGPKDQYRLRDIATGLDLTIDYGFLWWLAQPLFWLLNVIYALVNNWGYAIIGLTIIVKMVLYPLSAASFRSMAKMRKLQPEMARLKERHGDDRQKFSMAMMDLYKKEGANPLGGCLPILLQMPVFLALYWTLMESVEIRQAPFALWIHDLSAMDPYFILPILMGGSMWVTQSLQPEPPDPVQAKVFKLMPIMFTFFFLWFPSGLVLYWLVNNILSIMQQWYVNRQIIKGS